MTADPSEKSDSLNGLTCIRRRIHCAATRDAESSKYEKEEIDIDNFFGTLARVALAVAARERAKWKDWGEVDQ